MANPRIAAPAERLLGAYRDRVAVPPLTASDPELTLAEAYEIQQTQVKSWLATGDRLVGFKVGLTSPQIQRQLGVDSPDFGHLLRSMEHTEAEPLDPSAFISPRVEPEIAVVLGRELSGPGVTVREVARAVESVHAAIEIIDSRVADWKITLVDTVADNASSGGFVLGAQSRRLDELTLPTLGCTLSRNGEIVHTGAGGAVLGNPLHAVAWLANAFGAYGQSLPAGSVILAGALTAAVPIAAGDQVTATLAGLGSITIRVAETEQNA